jgi:ketosteroid isomerase-like protein
MVERLPAALKGPNGCGLQYDEVMLRRVLAASSLLMLQPSTAAIAQPAMVPVPAAPVVAFFDAINKGDAAGAADVFAPNGVYISGASKGSCSPQSPCTGRSNIEKAVQGFLKSSNLCETVTYLYVQGDIVMGRAEVRSDEIRAKGIDHITVAFLTQVESGKIAVDVERKDEGAATKGPPMTTVPACRTYAPSPPP